MVWQDETVALIRLRRVESDRPHRRSEAPSAGFRLGLLGTGRMHAVAAQDIEFIHSRRVESDRLNRRSEALSAGVSMSTPVGAHQDSWGGSTTLCLKFVHGASNFIDQIATPGCLLRSWQNAI